MTNTEIGKYGEDLAVNYLKKQGYDIIERNFHYAKYGEIDIVALKNEHLSFIEVKTRKNLDFGHPLEFISKSKLKKIILSMQYFLSQTKIKYKTYGLDAISIISENNKIEHIKNIEM